jgi:hypothetical protein
MKFFSSYGMEGSGWQHTMRPQILPVPSGPSAQTNADGFPALMYICCTPESQVVLRSLLQRPSHREAITQNTRGLPGELCVSRHFGQVPVPRETTLESPE